MSDLKEVLDTPMDPKTNDAGASSVREYALKLASAVWYVGEGFSGKRPFGNSSWEYEVYDALAAAGVIDCEYDDMGYVGYFDTESAHDLVSRAIDSMMTEAT